MNPSSNNINNPLIDLHQQKKQKKRQQQLEQHQLQTNGLFYNTATPIISGQYNNHGADPQASLPSLSNLMSTHSAIVASGQPTMTVDGQHQQMMQRAADSSIHTGNNRNSSYDVATPMSTQIKQENHIYNTNDQKIIGGSVYNHHLDNTHRQGYNDNKTLSQRQQALSQVRRPSNATLTSSKNMNSQMTAAMDNNSLTFYQKSPVLDVPSSSTGNTNNVETFFNPSMQSTTTSTQPFDDFNQQKLEDPHKIYSFVPLDVISQQKRPRKKFNEVERLYQCTYLNCTKAYGTLNHLNAHVTMQGHGPKRLPAEFKELRKQLKNNRQKKQGIKESPTTQTQKSTPLLQQNQNYHRFLIDNRNGSNLNNQNDPYVAAAIASSGSNSSSSPMITNQHSYRPYHPEHHYPQNQSFAQPYQARPQAYQQSLQQQQQQQQYIMMQQTDHQQSFQ